MNSIDDRAGVLERATTASSVLSTRPAGVDEPAVGFGGFHLLGEHGCVARGVADEEGCAVAGGECREGLEDAVFGAGGFGGVPGEEVVARLFGGELADGREDTVGVAGEHDDVRRLVGGRAGN